MDDMLLAVKIVDYWNGVPCRAGVLDLHPVQIMLDGDAPKPWQITIHSALAARSLKMAWYAQCKEDFVTIEPTGGILSPGVPATMEIRFIKTVQECRQVLPVTIRVIATQNVTLKKILQEWRSHSEDPEHRPIPEGIAPQGEKESRRLEPNGIRVLLDEYSTRWKMERLDYYDVEDILVQVLGRLIDFLLRLRWGIVDLEEEVTAKVLQRVSQFRGVWYGQFCDWVKRVIKDVMKRHLRRRLETISLEELEESGREPADKRDLYDDAILKVLIDDILSRLPEVFRIALTLRYLEGLSSEKCAQLQGITRVTERARVKRALSRALEILMENNLEDDYGFGIV